MDSKLYNGDCIEIMKDLVDESVDCILTDPPYNLGLFMHKRNTNIKQMRENSFAYAGWDNLDYQAWYEVMKTFFYQCSRVLKKKGTLLVFMSIIKVESIIKIAEEFGFYYKTTGIWHKTNPMPRNMNIQYVNSTECWIYMINQGTSGTFNNAGKLKHDFIESSICPISEKKFGKHPTQKPLKIIKDFIITLTNPNDIVLDPFMGSGTTCVASLELGRKYLGIEIDKNYYTIAQHRIENMEEEK